MICWNELSSKCIDFLWKGVYFFYEKGVVSSDDHFICCGEF